MYTRKKNILLWVAVIITMGISFPIIAQQPDTSVTDTSGYQTIVEEKLENLSPELQERAKHFGYQENENVALWQYSSGAFFILPPIQENLDSKEILTNLINLIYNKITKDITDNLDITAMISFDGTGYFTVILNFEKLYEDLQKEAEKNGYKKSDRISLQIDMPSWEYHILPKEKEYELTGTVLRIIPSEKPGGYNTYRLTADYSSLPKDMKKQAKKAGYGSKDMVRFIYKEENHQYEFLPFRVQFGCPWKFADLSAKNQKQALRAGYKEGDVVYYTNILGGKIIPADQVIGGPLIVIEHAEFKNGVAVLYGTIKSDDLTMGQIDKAHEIGYKKIDKVWVKITGGSKKAEVCHKPYIPKF